MSLNLTGRDRIAVVVIAALALIGVYWFMLLTPKRHEAAKLATEIAAQRQTLAATQSQIASYSRAKKDYPHNYATVVGLGKAVPASADVPSLIYTVSSTAKRSNVVFSSLAVSGGSGDSGSSSQGSTTGASGAGAPSTPFTFVFDGPFFRLSDFIQRLQDYVRVQGDHVDVSGRLLRIDGFSLQTGGTDGASTGQAIQANISASGFESTAGSSLLAGSTPQAPAGVASGASQPQPSGSSAEPSTIPSATVVGARP